jgi:hypothetical protein
MQVRNVEIKRMISPIVISTGALSITIGVIASIICCLSNRSGSSCPRSIVCRSATSDIRASGLPEERRAALSSSRSGGALVYRFDHD